MRKFIAVMLFYGVFCTLNAEEIKLPAPRKSGGMSVREALNSRRTIRNFQDKELSLQLLADMLWSANGVNRPNGKRTAPSAMDRREVMIYAALKDGTYLYNAEKHLLEKVSSADLRSACGRFNAPCYFILVPDRSRQSRELFAAVDTGYVSQNIYLAAQANGLGTCAAGSISDADKLISELKLGKNRPFLVHPVGFVK